VSVISTLISFGSSWLPTSGADYCDVGPYDLSAFSYWEGQIPGSENPLREYCFNEFHWDVSSNAPQSYYGLKIWAYVYLNGPVGDVQAFWLGPLYLQIVNPHPSGGGGGCPMLSVFNWTGFASEGLLDIHDNATDVMRPKTLSTHPARLSGYYLFKLQEHPLTHSYIDQVRLLAYPERGLPAYMPPKWAIHSEDGNVLPRLLASDDWRTETTANQTIYLVFQAVPEDVKIIRFVFVIEGYNPIAKM